jgi:DNA-binding transcriptional ArsR family regulator
MRRLSPALKREIRAFAFMYEDAAPDAILPPAIGTRPTFHEQLDAWSAMPLDDFAYDVARPLYHFLVPDSGGRSRMAVAETREAAAERAAFWGEDSRRLAELVFDDPEEVRRRTLELLATYWDEAFAREWERLEPQLVAEIDDAERTLAERGLYGLLDGQPELRIDRPAGVITRPSPHEHEVDVTSDQPLMLVPSAYVWPHVRVNCDAPFPLAIVYPARFARVERELPPAELVRVFRALGDATRLRSLRLIAERPRSTEELATLVGMSESGLSKHVKALEDAGLVERRRRGYYVLYALNHATLSALPGDLSDFVNG